MRTFAHANSDSAEMMWSPQNSATAVGEPALHKTDAALPELHCTQALPPGQGLRLMLQSAAAAGATLVGALAVPAVLGACRALLSGALLAACNAWQQQEPPLMDGTEPAGCALHALSEHMRQ